MKSYLLLSFRNEQHSVEFLKKRSREITAVSIFLLIQRSMFGIFLLISFLEGRATQRRIILHMAGLAWHLFALVIGQRFPLYCQKFHAAQIILSFSLYLANEETDFTINDAVC